MIESNIFLVLCEHFKLGQLLTTPTKIHNSTLHQVWRLLTTTGNYAVKEFNRDIQQLKPNYLIAVQRFEMIADNMQQQNIPTIVALKHNQNYELIIRTSDFLVYPWINGKPLVDQEISLNHAELIGSLLADIHHADLKVSDLSIPKWQGYSRLHWELLFAEAKKLSLMWEHLFAGYFSDLIEWNELAKLSQQTLSENLVVSHRDLLPQNVLWCDEFTPIIIDWEYAGLIPKTLELLIVALNWSYSSKQARVNFAKFNAVLSGYQAKTVLPHFSNHTIDNYLGYILHWIEFNLRRAIYLTHHADIAYQEIMSSITVLQYIVKHRLMLIN